MLLRVSRASATSEYAREGWRPPFAPNVDFLLAVNAPRTFNRSFGAGGIRLVVTALYDYLCAHPSVRVPTALEDVLAVFERRARLPIARGFPLRPARSAPRPAPLPLLPLGMTLRGLVTWLASSTFSEEVTRSLLSSASGDTRRALEIYLHRLRRGELHSLSAPSRVGRMRRRRVFAPPNETRVRFPLVYRVRKYRSSPRVPKPHPSIATPSSVRAWVFGEAAELMRCEKRRGVFPCINSDLSSLLWSRGADSLSSYASRLRALRVSLYDPVEESVSVGPNLPVYLCGLPVPDRRSLHLHWECLRRDRSIRAQLFSAFASPLSQYETHRIRTTLRRLRLDVQHRRSCCGSFQGARLSRSPPSRDSVPVTSDVASTMFAFTLTHRIEGLDEALSALQQFANQLAPTIGQEVGRFIAFIAALCVMETPAQIVAAIAQYVVGIPGLHRIVAAGLDRLRGIASQITGVQFQSSWAASASEAMGAFCSEVFSLSSIAMVFPLVSTLFGSFAGLSLIASGELAATFQKATVVEGSRAFARALLSNLMEVAGRIRRCYEERSLRPLLGVRWDPKTWCAEANGLIRYYPQITCRQGVESSSSRDLEKLVAAGELPSYLTSRVSLTRFKEILETYIQTGERFREALPDSRGVISVLAGLQALKTNVVATEFGAAYRPEPFGIYLFGSPGTGKSTLAGFLSQAIANKCGYDSTPAASYVWKPASNFQDGLSHLVWCIKFDDCDQSLAKPSAGHPTHFDSWLEVVNTVPWLPEQAAVDLKGRISVQPLLAMFCSNYSNANLSGVTNQPGAFWRRCKVYAEVCASADYADPHDGKISSQKAGASFDAAAWRIRLFRSAPASSDDTKAPFTFAQEMTVGEFSKFVIARYEAHMNQQFSRLSAPKESAFCPQCFLPSSLACSCLASVELQMDGSDSEAEEDAAVEDAEEEDPSRVPRFLAPRTWRALSREDRADFFPAYVARIADSAAARRFFDREALDDHWEIATPRGSFFIVPRRLYGDYFLVPDIELALRDDPDRYRGTAMRAYLHLRRITPDRRGYPGWARDFVLNGITDDCRTGRDRFRELGFEEMQTEPWRIGKEWSLAESKLFSFETASVLALLLGFALCLRLVRTTFQSRESNSVPDFVPATWKRAEQVFSPSLPPPSLGVSYTKDQLVLAVRESTFKFSSERGECYALAVGAGLVVLPTHALRHGERATLTLPGPRAVSIQRSPLNSLESSATPELLLMRVPEVSAKYSLLPYLQVCIDEQLRSYDELEILLPGRASLSADGGGKLDTWPGGKFVTCSATTAVGDCGSAYIARVGPSWRLVGMHYARLTYMLSGYRAAGSLLTKLDLARCAHLLGHELQFAVTPEGQFLRDRSGLGEVRVKEYPAKSEVWAAFSRGASLTPIGELVDAPPGFTPGTKVSRTAFAHFFSQLERDVCGSSPYWGPPVTRGRMEGEYWSSPYQKSLLAFKPERMVDWKVHYLAIMDYLNDMHLLSPEGYRALSEAEALTGVDGSWVNAVDPKTSVGPPYNEKKFRHIARRDHEAWYSPEFRVMLADVDATLALGFVPAPIGRCVLKDEPRAPGKFARVFCVLPAAWNMRYKQALAPILIFQRAHPTFFECYIGVDMTGEGCEDVVRHLASIDPTLAAVDDGDVIGMDSCYSGFAFDFLRHTRYAQAFHLELDRVEVERFVIGVATTRFVIKGDVFEGPRNPSGQQATGEDNSATNSYFQRYGYYKLRRDTLSDDEVLAFIRRFRDDPRVSDPRLDFRLKNAVATYGDDYNATRAKGVSIDWDSVASELGFRVTNATKDGPPEVGPIGGKQFLKRTFGYYPSLGRWCARLDRASIIRMCVTKMPTTLSERDHSAQVLSGALRESVFHGGDFYEAMRDAILRAADSHGFADHPYLVAPPHAEMWALVHQPGFRVYQPEDGLSPRDRDILVETRMEMQHVSNAPSAQSRDATTTEQAAVSHPLGEITTLGPVVEAPYLPSGPALQEFHETPLSSFFERPAEITTITLSATDPITVPVATFKPWQLFMANPAVADKMKNFSFVRGEIEVEIIAVFPSGCYGAYQVSAIPDPLVNPTIEVKNCRQYDHNLRIKCASGGVYKLKLPWFYWYEYGSISNLEFAGFWNLYVSCLAPIQSSVPGGVKSGYLRVFARLLPGWDVVVPTAQMAPKPKHRHIARLEEATAHFPKSGPVSSVAVQVGAVAEKLAGIPMVGTAAGAVAQAATVVGSLASFFGYTRENQPRDSLSVFSRPLHEVARTDATDHAEAAVLRGDGKRELPPVGIGEPVPHDTLAFASLFERPTLIARATITTATAVGVPFLTIPVTPFYVSNIPGSVADSTAVFDLSLPGYIGLPFQYWRGDLRYHIEVIAATIHEGAIQVAWYPYQTSLGTNPTNVLNNVVFDLSDSPERVFEVGYARHIPYCTSALYPASIAIPPVASTNGTLALRLLTPLQTQDAGNTVVVLVWLSASPNLEFAVPRSEITVPESDGVVVADLCTQVTLQMSGKDALGAEGPQKVIHHSLNGSSGFYPTDTVNFPGLSVRSVRAMLQKPQWSVRPSYPSSTIEPVDWNLWRPQYNDRPQGFSYESYYLSLFSGAAYSLRLQVMTPEDAVVSVGVDGSLPMTYAERWPICGPAQRVGPNGGASFMLPYAYPAKFLPTRKVAWTPAGFYPMGLTNLAGAPVKSVQYRSCGDDLEVGPFLGVPTVTFNPKPAVVKTRFW